MQALTVRVLLRELVRRTIESPQVEDFLLQLVEERYERVLGADYTRATGSPRVVVVVAVVQERGCFKRTRIQVRNSESWVDTGSLA